MTCTLTNWQCYKVRSRSSFPPGTSGHLRDISQFFGRAREAGTTLACRTLGRGINLEEGSSQREGGLALHCHVTASRDGSGTPGLYADEAYLLIRILTTRANTAKEIESTTPSLTCWAPEFAIVKQLCPTFDFLVSARRKVQKDISEKVSTFLWIREVRGRFNLAFVFNEVVMLFACARITNVPVFCSFQWTIVPG